MRREARPEATSALPPLCNEGVLKFDRNVLFLSWLQKPQQQQQDLVQLFCSTHDFLENELPADGYS